MNNEWRDQQRKILETAAKACEIVGEWCGTGLHTNPHRMIWNPLTNPAACAAMCAKLKIDTLWDDTNMFVECNKEPIFIQSHFKSHDNSRLRAWMHAATMVAAKIGGYKE